MKTRHAAALAAALVLASCGSYSVWPKPGSWPASGEVAVEYDGSTVMGRPYVAVVHRSDSIEDADLARFCYSATVYDCNGTAIGHKFFRNPFTMRHTGQDGAVYWTSRDFVFVTGTPDFPLTVKIVRRAGQGRPVEYEMVEYEIRKRSWHD